MAVRRLNDWVPQVRLAARERLASIASSSDAQDIVDVLCAVLPHSNSWARLKDDEMQTLLTIASSKTVIPALKMRLMTGTAGPLTSVLSQLGRISILDLDLYDISKSAIQPSVRAKAYKSLLEGKATWNVGHKWEWTDVRYCKGHFVPVLCCRPLTNKSPFEEILRSACLDRSPLVRRIAGDILIRNLQILGNLGYKLANILQWTQTRQ